VETDEDNNTQEAILHQLELLNKRLAKQNSFWSVFRIGVIYGVGFFIGSAVLATIALGAFGPWVASHVDWVAKTYERGAELK